MQPAAQTRFLHRNADEMPQLDQLAWQLPGHQFR